MAPQKPKTDIEIAVMFNDITYIKSEVTEIRKKLDSEYVTKSELDPIKKIVYGLVGLILVGVMGALLALVLR